MALVNVIYCDRQPEDYERLLKEFEVQGIRDYKFWEGVTDKKTVVENINASHKMIVRWAMEHGLDEVAIAEQDLYFPAKDGWEYFVKNKPEHYSIYSAATYVDDLEDKNILCGFHLYYLHHSFYQDFLSVPDTGHIDTEVDRLKGNFKVCRPFAALQRAGWSFNHSQKVDYNIVLKPEMIYGDTLCNI